MSGPSVIKRVLKRGRGGREVRHAVWEGLDVLLLALELGESGHQPRNAGGL